MLSGALALLDEEKVPRFGLNAPFGARCFLALFLRTCGKPLVTSLNAPTSLCSPAVSSTRLNTPFGARYFLTVVNYMGERELAAVLMHLLAFGAF